MERRREVLAEPPVAVGAVGLRREPGVGRGEGPVPALSRSPSRRRSSSHASSGSTPGSRTSGPRTPTASRRSSSASSAARRSGASAPGSLRAEEAVHRQGRLRRRRREALPPPGALRPRRRERPGQRLRLGELRRRRRLGPVLGPLVDPRPARGGPPGRRQEPRPDGLRPLPRLPPELLTADRRIRPPNESPTARPLPPAPPRRGERGGRRATARWPVPAVGLMAADAAAAAPPDFKRMLAKNPGRLMEGVKAGLAASPKRDAAARRAALAAGARADREGHPRPPPLRGRRVRGGRARGRGLAPLSARRSRPRTRRRSSPSPGAARPSAATRRARSTPPRPSSRRASRRGTPRDAYDASLTLSARLLAWIWKTAGGDASVATARPESKGPYQVR